MRSSKRSRLCYTKVPKSSAKLTGSSHFQVWRYWIQNFVLHTLWDIVRQVKCHQCDKSKFAHTLIIITKIVIMITLIIIRTIRTLAFWEYPPPPHDYPYYWFILDPKSNQDKVKITNLIKNLPKLQISKILKKLHTWHTFGSCLIINRWTTWNQYTPFQLCWIWYNKLPVFVKNFYTFTNPANNALKFYGDVVRFFHKKMTHFFFKINRQIEKLCETCSSDLVHLCGQMT